MTEARVVKHTIMTVVMEDSSSFSVDIGSCSWTGRDVFWPESSDPSPGYRIHSDGMLDVIGKLTALHEQYASFEKHPMAERLARIISDKQVKLRVNMNRVQSLGFREEDFHEGGE